MEERATYDFIRVLHSAEIDTNVGGGYAVFGIYWLGVRSRGASGWGVWLRHGSHGGRGLLENVHQEIPLANLNIQGK